MKKIIRNAGILFLIFAAAIVMYFISARNTMEKESAVYTSLDEPTMPVIYTECFGKEINCLRGYIQDMGNQVVRDSISVLPEDRRLSLRIAEYGNTITGISYEIRNLSMDRLVERTELTQWESKDGNTTAVLPIQNLLTKDETYLLKISVDTGEKDINYYTRIVWANKNHAEDMLNLAEEFTEKSLDYEQARDLVSYLETNASEDNSSLGHVTIKASFKHLTWDGLDVEMAGKPLMTLQEYNGIMGQIQVKYQVRINLEEGSQLVNVEDNFTMKWNEQRIYLMNYERFADEVFDGSRQAFSGKKILLGITRDEKMGTMKSPKSGYIAFKANENVWCYDQSGRRIICLFSFDSQTDDGIRSGYDKHGVKILSVHDDGTVDFLVYGYMNRGPYEGQTGVVYYSYRKDENTVKEKFFIPAAESYEKIKADVDRLSYLNPSNMMYLMLDGSVYGIDLKSNESLVVAQGLAEGSFAVSEDGSRFAWQESGDTIYQSQKVNVMDFQNAQKQEIIAKQGEYVRVLGFVDNDLIYGLGRADDTWIINGRIKGLPMYAMYIVDSQMNVESEYKKEGIYISDVKTEEGRIHLKRLLKLDQNNYVYQDEDTIVCNQKIDKNPLKGIGWYTSNQKGKLYFVQTDSEIKTAALKISVPKAFSYEETSTLELGSSRGTSLDEAVIFYAYGGGQYLGCSKDFKTAVNLAYEKMGIVTDENQRIVWDRINRNVIRNLKAPEEAVRKLTKHLDTFTESKEYEDGILMINGEGCDLNRMLYFIDKGIPVIAYVESGNYVLLTGYDQYNVNLLDPATSESWKMGLGDAGEYFKGRQNDFICGLELE